MRRLTGIWLCIVLMLSGTVLAEGVKISLQIKNADGKVVGNSAILFDREHLRIDTNEDNEQIRLIFNAAEKKLLICDMNKKTMTEMTEVDVAELSSQMKKARDMMNSPEVAEAMKKAREALKDLPEDQRAVAEQYMKGMGMGDDDAEEEKPYYEKAGSETVNGKKCTKFVKKNGGKIENEAWIADYDEFGLSKSDFVVYEKMDKFLEQLSATQNDGMADMFILKYGKSGEEAAGIPIKSIDYDDDQVMVYEVTDVARVATQSSDFASPEGFQKMKMMR